MRADDIRLLFDYSYGATGRILSAAGRLTSEEFTWVPPIGGGASVRDILVHTLDAEWGWRSHLSHDGSDGSPELIPADFPDIPTLAAAWSADEVMMREWLATLDDQAMDAPESGRGRPLWVCLAHVVNHGTQHRSEAAMILTHLGQSPGELDFTFFLRDWTDD